MSDNIGYDPFAASDTSKLGAAADVQPGEEPLEHLLATEASAGEESDWEPITESSDFEQAAPLENGFEPSPPMGDGDLDSLVLDVDNAPSILDNQEPIMRPPLRHNPLPGAEAAPAPAATQEPQSDPHQEILQGAQDRASSGVRERLPSRTDAPAVPLQEEARPMAWLLPAAVALLGTAAGAYVMMGSSAVLGGIAIALSVVGALFLRVLLDQ